MMAFFVSLFRQVVLNTKVHEQMKPLRYRVFFTIGGYIIQKRESKNIKVISRHEETGMVYWPMDEYK